MNYSQSNNSQEVCEHILINAKQYNIEHNILPSENAVIDRLLARSVELASAYEELHSKLHSYPNALRVFLGIILRCAAFWNPEKMLEARTARNELTEVNQQIARKAAELADLLAQRDDLHNTSGFNSDTHYHIYDVVREAAKSNPLFEMYVQEQLDVIHTQFDFKYWPTLSDCLQELALNAEAAISEASDPLTAAGTIASRPSLADFFKVLFSFLEESKSRRYNQLPRNFEVSDNTLASLANCALNLPVDDLKDGPYVKRLRQRMQDSDN